MGQRRLGATAVVALTTRNFLICIKYLIVRIGNNRSNTNAFGRSPPSS